MISSASLIWIRQVSNRPQVFRRETLRIVPMDHGAGQHRLPGYLNRISRKGCT